MLKNVIIFSIGAAVGAAASYFYFKDKFKEEEERKAQEEIESIKKIFYDKEKELENVVQKTKKELSEAEFSFPEIPGFSKDRDEKEEEEDTKTYKSYANLYKKEEPKKHIKEDIPKTHTYPREGLAEKPYIIDEDTFATTGQFHSKETLYYYEDRGILTDENDIPVDDPGYLVGNDYMEKFDPTGYVYVRNERAAADFEIVLCQEFPEWLVTMTGL